MSITASPGDAVRVYTIGHSSLPLEDFLSLLRRHGITLLVDVRSEPFSRHAPQFNKAGLEQALATVSVAYRYAGATLGGKPKDSDLRSVRGVPDYDRMAAVPAFTRALEHLIDLAGAQPVAVMCSEGDPMQCHREKLLARELRARGVEVCHILGDGSIAPPPAQGSLL